jgi:hypothetical protein
MTTVSKPNGRGAAAPPAAVASPTLEYRSPAAAAAGSPRVERGARELAGAEALGGAAVGLKWALGVPLSLIGPFVLSSFLFGIDRRLQTGIMPGFGATFLLVTAAVVPLLMWLERRSRGEFFLDSVRGEPTTREASSGGEYELQSAKFGWLAWTEVALTGPRLIWEAIDAQRGRPAACWPRRSRSTCSTPARACRSASSSARIAPRRSCSARSITSCAATGPTRRAAGTACG